MTPIDREAIQKEMEAGREMDALVAEKVMGYEWARFDYPPAGERYRYGKPWTWLVSPAYAHDKQSIGDEERYIGNVARYSTDIAAAWQVVERMQKLGWAFGFQNVARCDAAFSHRSGKRERVNADNCETAPLAICRAALLAMESFSALSETKP